MSDDGPKSAFELAMERLRQKDTEARIDDRPLTDEQKAAIAEGRQFYKSKVAEREILHQAALRNARTHDRSHGGTRIYGATRRGWRMIATVRSPRSEERSPWRPSALYPCSATWCA